MTDWTTGLLPETVAADVLTAAEEASAVMSLATVRQMPSGIEWLPLVEVQPQAAWIDTGARKPYSAIDWGAEKLVARELAVTTYVPDAIIADTTFNVEAETERELAAAVARAFDLAVLFGTDAPDGFPAGGIASAPVTGPDALDALDKALAVVEASGVQPNGIVAGPEIGSALRQAYIAAGALPSEAPSGLLFGLPVRVVANWDASKGDAIVGAFQFLQIGVRQDITVDRSQDAVLTTGDPPVIVVSAFESDVTVVRCHARFGCVLGRPVGPGGDPVVPFATAEWSTASASAQRQRGSGGRYTSKPEAA